MRTLTVLLCLLFGFSSAWAAKGGKLTVPGAVPLVKALDWKMVGGL